MRVIAGIYRSRILKSLKGLTLRPTSDRLRETLFDVLGPGVAGSRFIDLFAGTGAVGIEALSRGAGEVVFVADWKNLSPVKGLIPLVTTLFFLIPRMQQPKIMLAC
jgi:16S rRNA (guanine966-N2)-methyltransferase